MNTPNALDMFCLKGKVALVTGGACGLGFDMAQALAQAGADVVVTSLMLGEAQEAAEKIRAIYQVDTLGLQLDHCDWPNVQALAAEAQDWKGHVDILVNNAGGGSGQGEGNLFKRDSEDIVGLINTNLLGPLYCCKAFGSAMLERGSGKIINIASIAGLVGRDRRMYQRNNMDEQPIEYAAAKAGVIGMTKDLAALMSPQGVNVNAISPGAFDKSLLPKSFVSDFADETMLGRLGEMGRDLKGVALFLASPASDYVTGANIVVDGGFSTTK